MNGYASEYVPWSTKVKTTTGAFDASLPVDTMHSQYIIGVFLNAVIIEAVDDEVKKSFSFLPFTDEMNLLIEKEIEGVNQWLSMYEKEKIIKVVFGIKILVRWSIIGKLLH